MSNEKTKIAADKVQVFYDRYPYPRPVDSLDKYHRLWQDPQRRRADYHLFWPARPYREDSSILIAGCGTSQAAKHAIRWPSAQVTGIDFSATSVRHTEELKKKYKLDNLTVRQLPVERVGELETSFDQIVCTGVLHHLADPDAGLKALSGVLKPDGAMHLMVYAPYGRTGIYMLQEFCQRLGIHATDAEIRDLIAALKLLPPGHPLETLLREAPDFRQEAELADALLHPQDRAYSVPQLFEFIERAGLTFGRWIKQAPYSPHCGVIAKTPAGFAAGTTSPSGAVCRCRTFSRHDASSQRRPLPQRSRTAVRSVSAVTIGLVMCPSALADTICIQERLPAGAAAVLINQTHTYRDLFMPINSTEKRWFDAMNGKRSIGNIVEVTRPSAQKKSQPETARSFFERLWWYDQIVFDASPPESTQ